MQAVSLLNASNIRIEDNLLAFSHGHSLSIRGQTSAGNNVRNNLGIGAASNSLLMASDMRPAMFYTEAWNNSFR